LENNNLVRILFSSICFFFFLISVAQKQYTSFTMRDGLPSNLIYRCMEDDKGFLWMATDAGIARFDGKNFQVFTTKDGLPDNEVLDVVKENNGTIWVNCFKQAPAYFDYQRNKFIIPTIEKTTPYLNYMYTLPQGGVMYMDGHGNFIFRDKKLVAQNPSRPDLFFRIWEINDGSLLSLGTQPLGKGVHNYQFKLVHYSTGKIIDSVLLGRRKKGYMPQAVNNGSLFIFDSPENKCFVYSHFLFYPLRFNLDSINIPCSIANYSFTPTSICLLGVDGKLYIFNKTTFNPEGIFEGDYLANSYLNDSKGNIWISTIDKGVIVYRKNHVKTVAFPDNFTRTNFISIAKKKDGTIYAGNYYGEVIESRDDKFHVHHVARITPSRERKIIVTGNKIYTFSEEGITENFGKPMIIPGTKFPYVGKTAILYNDSIIIGGTGSGLIKINSCTNKIIPLKSGGRRITCISRVTDGSIYFGSTDGLYRYDMKTDTSYAVANRYPFLDGRISALAATSENILWVGTASSGLVILRNEKPVLHINESKGMIKAEIRTIISGTPGQVWLGSAQGMACINYRLSADTINYSLQNLSMSDGLSSNGINELIYQSDTIYAATANGISIIPANTGFEPFNIPVQIIKMTIDQRDTIITDYYELPAGRKNILISFSGVELNGHLKNLEYKLDDNASWIPLYENSLNLQLNYGHHELSVRSVDVNGNISKGALFTQFNIATPFQNSLLFWILSGILLQFIIVLFTIRWIRVKKESKLARQITVVQNASLEQQAFTSLMNPHFMFNALNSIQHYINVQDRQNANRYLSDFASLIRKNFEAAHQSFISLEQELENAKIYLRLEQMRFSGKFSYTFNIAPNVDQERWMVPTMMMQPLIENALLHGLMPSAIPGKLVLDIFETEDFLEIDIIDNGIGIKNSSKAREQAGHKSRGMELIHKRIAALNHFSTQRISIKMSPVFESDTNPGNKVIIQIPSELYSNWHKAHMQGVKKA
jgi:hypothetical protein